MARGEGDGTARDIVLVRPLVISLVEFLLCMFFIMRKHKLTIIFAVSTFVLFCILGIILIPKYIEIEGTINKTQTLIYLLQLAVGLLLGVGALFLAYKQIIMVNKQTNIGAIQNEINVLMFEIGRGENKRVAEHSAYMTLCFNADVIERPVLYESYLDKLKPIEKDINGNVAKLNEQLIKYEKEVNKVI